MATISKQLGQATEGSTNAVSVYSPPASTTAIVRYVTVSNHSGAPATFRIFHDDDGTTYDNTTDLLWDILIDADATVPMAVFWPVATAGNIAYRSSVASALTITLYGVEQT